jgi:hypothetical protein
MINVTDQERKDIYQLYDDVVAAPSTGLSAEHIIKFLRLRKLIFRVTITREAEFQILKLLLEKMAGIPRPHRPRFFIDYDFKDLNEVERSEKRKQLRKFFNDLPLTGDYAWETMSTKADAIMPASNRYDIEFGVEALRSILALTDELNKSVIFDGPNQDGDEPPPRNLN